MRAGSDKKTWRKQEIIIFMTNKLNKFITLFPPHFTVSALMRYAKILRG